MNHPAGGETAESGSIRTGQVRLADGLVVSALDMMNPEKLAALIFEGLFPG
jgi:hypothetical protein